MQNQHPRSLKAVRLRFNHIEPDPENADPEKPVTQPDNRTSR
jgi:hypothetical protein